MKLNGGFLKVLGSRVKVFDSVSSIDDPFNVRPHDIRHAVYLENVTTKRKVELFYLFMIYFLNNFFKSHHTAKTELFMINICNAVNLKNDWRHTVKVDLFMINIR